MPLSPAQINEEVKFWLYQDLEHMLFLALGLEDQTLKSQALQLRDEYQKALQANNIGFALNNVLPKAQAFKQQLKLAQASRWIGWIYPAFIDHVDMEMKYFLSRISPRGNSARDELCFGNKMGADHCALAAHLLDPTEKPIHNVLNHQLRPEAERNANACMTETYPMLLRLSRAAGAEIDKAFSGLDLNRTKSIIHPTLAAHVVREGKWFNNTLNNRLPNELMVNGNRVMPAPSPNNVNY